MARPTKQGIDYFPKWNPNLSTWNKINSFDHLVSFKALRNSSSAFIKNRYVRKTIFEKYNNKCIECSSTDHLQIDHIISVYLASKHKYLLDIINTKDNLQLLCKKCNSIKRPDEEIL